LTLSYRVLISRPLPPQLGDRGLDLRDRGADVRELDDVRLGRPGETAKLGERVVDPLIGGERVGEVGDDPPREGDVACLDVDPGAAGEGPDDRQERVGR